MKKSLILLGMLSIGYAHAQEYDGRVGINTEEPSATLQVKSKTGVDNSTHNLELTNAENKILVRVSDLGNAGIRRSPEVDLDINGLDGGNAEIRLTRYTDANTGANMTIQKAGGTFDNPTIPAIGSSLGRYRVGGYVGNNIYDGFASNIETFVAGVPTANNALPTNMILSVTRADGSRNRLLKLQSDTGVGIGFTVTYDVKEKLEVNGNVRIDGLKGTGSRPVFATADGVLTTGASSAIQVGNTDNITCTSANAGTMNYKEVERNGQQIGVFGFCIRRGSDYVWAYMAGGSNIFGTSANGAAFGDGLQ